MIADNALSIHEPPCSVRLRALRHCVVSRTGGSPFAGDNAMGNRIKVNRGDRYGQLTVVEEATRQCQAGRYRRQFHCRCVCGNSATVTLTHLRSGHTMSCGCFGRSGRNNRTHGRTGTQAYRAWADMLQRCHNPKRPAYQNYGARGITVCQRWRDSFAAFLADMGEPPTPTHSIDRVDNDGNYETPNCRWATKTEQSRNSRHNVLLTFEGATACVSEWAERLAMNPAVLYDRVRAGWSVEEVLTTPVKGTHE